MIGPRLSVYRWSDPVVKWAGRADKHERYERKQDTAKSLGSEASDISLRIWTYRRNRLAGDLYFRITPYCRVEIFDYRFFFHSNEIGIGISCQNCHVKTWWLIIHNALQCAKAVNSTSECYRRIEQTTWGISAMSEIRPLPPIWHGIYMLHIARWHMI